MPKAPAGAVVGLYVDTAYRLQVGDVVGTTTGRRYLVLSVRVQQRGAHAGRQHLRCLVGDGSEVPTITISWYTRKKKGPW